MKIVVALDKFRGSLTATEGCEIVRQALLKMQPDWEIVVKPMADGGEGTASALQTSLGGAWITAPVTGPLPGMSVDARYLWVAEPQLAVVEMANASGLVLLPPERRDPLKTTTFGTGELIRHAMERGARRILLGVGGSATVDGGVGAAMALGGKFLDESGRPVGLGGGELEKIAQIGRPGGLSLPVIEVLCDVDNPLCGEHGAARVFGPQKGATPEGVARLDAGLAHLARLVWEQFGKKIAAVPGAGAAGGLAAGAGAFLDARLMPGAETIMALTEMEISLRNADWVITGEGRFDAQSLRGKVVSAVTKLARQHGARVAVLAGAVTVAESAYRAAGVEVAISSQPPGMALEQALTRAPELLAAGVQRLAANCLASGR